MVEQIVTTSAPTTRYARDERRNVVADAVSSDYLPLGTTCSLSRAVNHRARSQSLAWISVLESGDQAIFLALQPDPFVDAAGAVAFAKQAGGYIIVGEVRVEIQPDAWQISAANVHQRCEQQCPFE